MIRRPPRSTQGVSSAASDVYKRQVGTLWDIFSCSVPPLPASKTAKNAENGRVGAVRRGRVPTNEMSQSVPKCPMRLYTYFDCWDTLGHFLLQWDAPPGVKNAGKRGKRPRRAKSAKWGGDPKSVPMPPRNVPLLQEPTSAI